MDEQLELYQKVHDQVLDYAFDEVIFPCALWGYGVHKKLVKHNLVLAQMGAEEAEDFIYAVTTAVIIGEFAQIAYGDHFNDEAGIDLSLLDLDFEQIRAFIDKKVPKYRVQFLDEGNSVGLQDMWTAICEYKKETHKSLKSIYEKEKGTDIDDTLYNSLTKLFEPRDEKGTMFSSMIDSRRLNAISYINNGFQY